MKKGSTLERQSEKKLDTGKAGERASLLVHVCDQLARQNQKRAGDVNGDGFDDIIVGAVGYPNSQERGAVYLMLGGER